MPNLITLSFHRPPNTYDLDLSWDDDAYAEGALSFEITARQRNDEDRDSVHSISARISVERGDDNEPLLKLEVEGYEVQWPLRALLEESQIIDLIPGAVWGLGDPLTGCLVRSGLSALIGQTIECKNATSGVTWYWPRIRTISRCMADNVPSISAKAALRAARCMLGAGII